MTTGTASTATSTAGTVSTGVERILSDELLGRSFSCQCGRQHRIDTRQVVIEPGVEGRVTELLADLAVRRVLLVADQRTWQAAGAQLQDALASSCSVQRCLLGDPAGAQLHASVELADEVLAAHADRYDLYIAVGSGTVNDLTKEIAHRRRRPYLVVATAASMNGYTSAIVALLERGLKTTRPATPPVAVFADPQVLLGAPRQLTLAGLGDLVSKPYCGCDWKIASLIRGDYHCPLPDRLLSEPFALAIDRLPEVGLDQEEAVVLLLRLLLVSGISMAVAGTSSPASGGEHLLSHFWDMMHLQRGEPVALHGAQVGVASLVIDDLYRQVATREFCQPAADRIADPDPQQARQELQQVFGSLGEVVWPQWQAKLAARSARDREQLCRHQAAIKAEIERTIDIGVRVRRAISACGVPARVEQLGITRAELAAAVRHGRKIRNRYTVLDVAAELGLLEPFADRLAGEGV